MKAYIITAAVIQFFTFALIIYAFVRIKDTNNLILKSRREKPQNSPSPIIIALLTTAGLLFIFSLVAPVVLTEHADFFDFDFTKTGPIGDTFGGLMNPFIALAGVIVTGLAFYMQYEANKQQRDFFYTDQSNRKFESQFYEMLRLHRENITEMKISGYDFDDTHKRIERLTEGRKVFVTMTTELECLLSIYKNCHSKLGKRGFELAYEMFFWGIEYFEKAHKKESKFVKECWKARMQHANAVNSHKKKAERKKFGDVHLDFNYKPFSGHSSRLGHYFRHLYMTVRFVAQSEIVTDYKERMRFLKILRGQLSNHEQTVLFYNWFGRFGAKWENGKHHFFTEYCMIHNLWYHNLYKDDSIQKSIEELKNKPVSYRKREMFEMDEA